MILTGNRSGGGNLVGLSRVGGSALLERGLVSDAAMSRSCSSYCACCCCISGDLTVDVPVGFQIILLTS